MLKILSLLTILAMRLFYQSPVLDQKITPFANKSISNSAYSPKLTSFTADIRNNKIFLQWEVEENELADQFEIEKSNDGKLFTVAALVFGTDLPLVGKYWLFEKLTENKIYYRIKMISKTKKTEFSEVLEIKPTT